MGTPISVQYAFDEFAKSKKDVSDIPQATFVSWCNYINLHIYRYVKGIDYQRFIKTIDFPITAGTNVYPLPVDFRDIQEFSTGFFLPEDSQSNISSRRLPRVEPYSNVTGYYIDGTNVVFTPNQTVNKTYKLRYIPDAPIINSFSGSFLSCITQEYILYVIKALDVMYAQWDEDIIAESSSDIRFINALDELAKNIKVEPAAYALDDYSQSYSYYTNTPWTP